MARLTAGAVLRFIGARASEAFGPVFLGFTAVAVVSGITCYFVLGPESFEQAVEHDLALVASMLPRILAAVLVAGFVRVLLPRERIAALLGANSGLRGLMIAALAGTVTPGGPAAAFAFLVTIRDAGVDKGALVAYITGWSLLGVQRILVWDLPLMGAEFSLLRFAVSLPLPILAGWIARRVPLTYAQAAYRASARSGHPADKNR
jgi:uncharacterized membrane protein YraQ (UPF0718 family)